MTESCHFSTSLVHVMKMMLTRAMALRAKGYKVMQHLYWHSDSMLLNQMYYSITSVYSECKVSRVKPGRSLTTLVMEMHGVLIFQCFGVQSA